jgi:tight adherence protein B
MGTLLLLVFVVVFAAFAIVLFIGSNSEARESKQTIAVLDAALASDRAKLRDSIIDVRKSDTFSAIPWINRWLLQIEIAPQVRSLIYQSNVKWTVGTLLLLCAGSFFLAFNLAYMRTHGFLLSLLIGTLAGAAPFGFLLQKRAIRRNKFEKELPEAVDLMVNALRAGHSLISALGLVANEAPDPLGTEFRICFEEQNYGLDLRAAMENLVARAPLQDLRIIVAAILIQKESGGNLAEVLDKTSYVIRERFRLRRQVSVHTAQGRMTGWILTFLPVVLGLGLYFINPDNMSLLWKRDIGIKLLYAAGGMTVVGGLLIRKIVRIDV